jgi:hypothetical protein
MAEVSRVRWAAIGAAVAVSLGGGGIGLANAMTSSGMAVQAPITQAKGDPGGGNKGPKPPTEPVETAGARVARLHPRGFESRNLCAVGEWNSASCFWWQETMFDEIASRGVPIDAADFPPGAQFSLQFPVQNDRPVELTLCARLFDTATKLPVENSETCATVPAATEADPYAPGQLRAVHMVVKGEPFSITATGERTYLWDLLWISPIDVNPLSTESIVNFNEVVVRW